MVEVLGRRVGHEQAAGDVLDVLERGVQALRELQLGDVDEQRVGNRDPVDDRAARGRVVGQRAQRLGVGDQPGELLAHVPRPLECR